MLEIIEDENEEWRACKNAIRYILKIRICEGNDDK